jgi:hypothetical protein
MRTKLLLVVANGSFPVATMLWTGAPQLVFVISAREMPAVTVANNIASRHVLAMSTMSRLPFAWR